MANVLKGKTSVSIIYITPNERATEALRVFIEGHTEYMRTKSHETGPLRLIHYFISEKSKASFQVLCHTINMARNTRGYWNIKLGKKS